MTTKIDMVYAYVRRHEAGVMAYQVTADLGVEYRRFLGLLLQQGRLRAEGPKHARTYIAASSDAGRSLTSRPTTPGVND